MEVWWAPWREGSCLHFLAEFFITSLRLSAEYELGQVPRLLQYLLLEGVINGGGIGYWHKIPVMEWLLFVWTRGILRIRPNSSRNSCRTSETKAGNLEGIVGRFWLSVHLQERESYGGGRGGGGCYSLQMSARLWYVMSTVWKGLVLGIVSKQWWNDPVVYRQPIIGCVF